jgi:O-antigen ligase
MITAWRLEHVLICLAIFLSNFISWRVPEVNFTLGDVLFCVSLAVLAVQGDLPRLPFAGLTSLWYLCFAIFTLAMAASSMISGDPLRYLSVISQYGFAYIVLPFILMGRDTAISTRYLKTFAISMIVVCAVGLWFFHFTGIKVVLGHELISGSDRLGSFLGNANGFAGMVALTFPVVLYLWIANHLRGVIALPAVVVLGLAVVASSSVSGLATAVLGIIIFLVASGSLVGRGKVAAGFGLCLAVLITILWSGDVLPPTFERRVLAPLETGNLDELGTYTARKHLIDLALEALDGTLVLGMGADQFRHENDNDIDAPVHNAYLLVWVEGGLPALVGWLGLLGVIFTIGLQALTNPATRQAGALGLTVTLVFSIISFNSAHMYARFRLVPLFACLAVVLAAGAEDRTRRARLAAVPSGDAAARP